jgi:hypothetical protein
MTGLHLFSYVAQNTCLRVLIIYFFWLLSFSSIVPKVLLYVSFFTIGPLGAAFILVVPDTISINSYLIDAIALSMVYKGFDNLGGFKKFSEPH